MDMLGTWSIVWSECLIAERLLRMAINRTGLGNLPPDDPHLGAEITPMSPTPSNCSARTRAALPKSDLFEASLS
jgi:hypothetical protein